jgi:two-component system LytT family response regulator
VLSVGESPFAEMLEQRVIQVLTLPLEEAQLQRSLIHAQAEVYTRKAEELSYLLRQYTATSTSSSLYLASISVEHEGKKVHLDTRTIAAVLASANYCRLHTPSGDYEIRETMNGLCSKLDPTQFARIHRSVIVNTSQIRELSGSHDAPTSVVLMDGTELPVGPNFRNSLANIAIHKRA